MFVYCQQTKSTTQSDNIWLQWLGGWKVIGLFFVYFEDFNCQGKIPLSDHQNCHHPYHRRSYDWKSRNLNRKTRKWKGLASIKRIKEEPKDYFYEMLIRFDQDFLVKTEWDRNWNDWTNILGKGSSILKMTIIPYDFPVNMYSLGDAVWRTSVNFVQSRRTSGINKGNIVNMNSTDKTEAYCPWEISWREKSR